MAEAKAASQMLLEPVKEFRLLPHKEHTHGKFAVQPGDVIYLNARQASAFKDKFEPVDPNAPYKAQSVDINQKFYAIAEAREAGISVPVVPEPAKVPVAAA